MTEGQVEIDTAAVDEIVGELGSEPRRLVSILRRVQEVYNYLPRAALERISEITEMSPGRIDSVATFYPQFRLAPAGQHLIRVCIGTACYVKGAETLHTTFKQVLDIKGEADTDERGLFTIEKVACLGCCMLAPAIQIDDIVYGQVSVAGIEALLSDFLASQDRELPKGAAGRVPGRSVDGEVRVCTCTSCRAAGAEDVRRVINDRIDRFGLNAGLAETACTGISYRAPLVEIAMAEGRRFLYGGVTTRTAPEILARHLRPKGAGRRLKSSGRRALDRVLGEVEAESVIRYSVDYRDEIDGAYWNPQTRVTTEGAGETDPLDLKSYLARGGFSAYAAMLSEERRYRALAEITDSGLRGRGGAGYPTGEKWRRVRDAPGSPKYIVCNADEGDPGAFMDRIILESFPFRVLDGAAIAARVVGADTVLFYIRSEYPLAIDRMRRATEMCRAGGILEAGLAVEIEEGAGAFVCGEETALLAALEGRRGEPVLRPPYPSDQGLFGLPTLINNVETLATVPAILSSGPAAFAKKGWEGCAGTKTFALAGRIRRGGLVEVPMGSPLRTIVEGIGGGVQEGRVIKAVQIGGPSGGCLPEASLDLPVDFDTLAESGAMMGSGGLIVLDDTDCMVDVALYFMRFTQAESCGKCTCCRVGTKRMLELLELICRGEASSASIEELERLAGVVKRGSLCNLGKTAPNPVLSTLRYFREEYEAHVDGRCPAGRCKSLIRYVVSEACIGCTKCAQGCPVDAIYSRPFEPHIIDPIKCIRCGNCQAVCPADAVEVV